mgnify:CR=1 FL=1
MTEEIPTEFIVDGLPLRLIGLDFCEIHYPDGTRAPLTGITLKPGIPIETAIRDALPPGAELHRRRARDPEEAKRFRRQDIEGYVAIGLVGRGLLDNIETLEEAAEICARHRGNETLVSVLRLGASEIERLTWGLAAIAQETLVPTAFAPEEWEKLDTLRQIHASALLLSHSALQGDSNPNAERDDVPAGSRE